ncbi:MAG: UbiD family decarboxylase [Candidatus Diapherotrites archaeon]|nr:UbiD family decarboxylase [Candidatus Diapherotrites archaeon]
MNLRPFLQKLEEDGDLVRIKKEVSHEYEIASILNSLGERPTIFENVKGFDMPMFGGVCAHRETIAKGLGTTKEGILKTLVDALRNPKEPGMVDKAPCQEVVIKDVDLDKLPLLMHLPGDGGRYMSASVVVLKDPETGRNVSYHRMMQRGKDRLTARLIPKRQTRTTYDKTEGDLEIAVCIGSSIPVLLAASLGPPSGVDELSIANAMGETPLVKCVTKDLEVPAETEIVLEGRLTKDLDAEGPFVDLTETRDYERQEPVVVIDAITMRKDAMYQAILPGRLEHKTLMGMPKEPTIYDEVSKVCDCRNVYMTMGGGSWLHGIVQIAKKNDDEPKAAIDAAIQGHKSIKHVVIVDDEVDLFDPMAVEWAIATRFRADRDLVVKENTPSSSLDPVATQEPGKKAVCAKMGLDATRPMATDKKKFEKVEYGKVDVDEYLG